MFVQQVEITDDQPRNGVDPNVELDVDAALDRALTALIGQMRRVWHSRLRELDLTPPQAMALRMIATAPTPLGVIADELTFDASNMTGIADRLEERGLAHRSVDPSDRRVKLLEITSEGRKELARLDRPVVGEFPGIATLTPSEQSDLVDLLTRSFG